MFLGLIYIFRFESIDVKLAEIANADFLQENPAGVLAKVSQRKHTKQNLTETQTLTYLSLLK